MNEHNSKFTMFDRAVLIALIWLTALVGTFAPILLVVYIPMIIFLAFHLRPLLDKSGLADWASKRENQISDIRWRKITERRRREIGMAERQAKLKSRRYHDKSLPPNW